GLSKIGLGNKEGVDDESKRGSTGEASTLTLNKRQSKADRKESKAEKANAKNVAKLGMHCARIYVVTNAGYV
ncbi:hypothetical protein SARC_14365, partial [Sphaeroforma arctica JP610]